MPSNLPIRTYVQGSIASSGQTAIYDFNIPSDGSYDFWVQGTSSGGGTLVDPYVRLGAFSGYGYTTTNWDDDSGGGRDAAIINAWAYAGAHRLTVSSANGGIGSFSVWYAPTGTKVTQVPVASAVPVVATQDKTVSAGASIQASSLIASITDPHNYAITAYSFWDTGTGGGYLALNGVKQPAGQWIIVSAADLPKLTYVGGSVAGSEAVCISVTDDGTNWSDSNKSATVTTAAATVNNLTGTQTGGSGNDVITGHAGSETVNGGGGVDTFVLTGRRADYTVTKTTSGYTIVDNVGTGGTDTLIGIERLQFADVKIALDVSGNAGQVYRLYQAAFNRVPDKGGLLYWMSQADSNISLVDIAGAFVSSTEFITTYGNLSNHGFVDQLYQNILHRAGDPTGLAYWYGRLDSQVETRQQVLYGFSESVENQTAVMGTIQNGIDYTA